MSGKDFETGAIRQVGGGNKTVQITIEKALNDTISQEAFDMQGFSLVAFIMPAAWTAADLEFLAAENDADPEVPDDSANPNVNALFGNYVEVFDSAGVQVAMTVAAARVIVPTPSHMAALAALRFVRLQSSAAQAADRVITVILKS